MPIDRSFLEKIEEMSADFKGMEFFNLPHTSKQVYRVRRPLSAIIAASSLSAVVTYFIDKNSEMNEPLIHVVSPDTVTIYSALGVDDRERESYLTSILISDPFRFGRFMDIEMFVIALQSQFIQDETTAAILKVVGNLTEEAEQRVLDDGVSQTVTAKAGIAKVENVHVPNPVILRPFRTFREVEQPSSKFVFRMKKSRDGEGPQCALFEADGGAWKHVAMERISGFLVDLLPDGVTVIA